MSNEKKQKQMLTTEVVQDMLRKVALVRRICVDSNEFTYAEFDEMFAEIGQEAFETVEKWSEKKVVLYAFATILDMGIGKE